ncbi:histidine phosphatase superfamily [Aspergillus karnatakaensis]|uniref:histidine phosphatase superfamily n=1 Tax=Aspergillus karnatakaensis TaxID=1810916 RepID=UPI003CCD8844
MKFSTLSTLALSGVASAKFIEYTTVTGYFEQDDPATDPSTYDYTSHNFGLIDRDYDYESASSVDISGLSQWERFHRQLEYLNANSPKSTSYKLFFMGRHGEGWHNAAESYFGTPAWNCFYALLEGNSTHTWFDADLTPNGIEQANIAHEYWLHQYAEHAIHFPDSYYSSPMTRSLKTANITFAHLPLKQAGAKQFLPTVKEGFREGMSMHTCNHRRSKSYIADLFPTWKFEEGFTEEDELWTGVTSETSEAQDLRSRDALNDIFEPSLQVQVPVQKPEGVCVPPSPKKKNLVVSITAHSGEITSLLRVIGHQPFRLSTGAVIPVLIRAEEVEEAEPTTTAVWTQSAYCTEPPTTSTEGACVCATGSPVTSGYPVFATQTAV